MIAPKRSMRSLSPCLAFSLSPPLFLSLSLPLLLLPLSLLFPLLQLDFLTPNTFLWWPNSYPFGDVIIGFRGVQSTRLNGAGCWRRAIAPSFKWVILSRCTGFNGLLESAFPDFQVPGLSRLNSRCHLSCVTCQRDTIITTVNIKGAPTMCQARWRALYMLQSHVTLTSTLWVPSFYGCGDWGPERLSSLPNVSQAGRGRARIPNQVHLTPNSFLFTSQPLHTASTVGKPDWIAVCKQLAKAALQQI